MDPGYFQEEDEWRGEPPRLLLLSGLFGLAALILYGLTVSHGVFPGVSAVLMTQIAGLEPPRVPDHPLWRLLAAGVAKVPLLTLPLRLNLLSGILGGLAVALTFRLMASRVWRMLGADVADDREALRASRLAGAAAAIFLGLSTVCWSAATRLHPACLELVLALLALNLLERYDVRGGVGSAHLLALLTGIGALESPAVLALAPFLIVSILVLIYQRRGRVRWRFLLGLTAAGLLGVALSLLLAACVAVSDGDLSWRTLAVLLVRNQAAELRAWMPRVGWVSVLLLGYLPWLLLQFTGRDALNFGKLIFDRVLHTCLTVIVALMVFDIPGTPWARIGRGGRMVVLPYLLTAWVASYLMAYWYVRFRDRGENASDDEHQNTQKSAPVAARSAGLGLGQAFAGLMALGLSAVLLIAGGLHGREAHGGRGDFMDACARDVLATLGSRTWLATDGSLDPHLQLLTLAEHRPLKLVRLNRDRDRIVIRTLQQQIAADTLFAGRSVRLQNSAALGATAFLQEWLSSDTNACSQVAILGISSPWTEAGLHPLPDRLIFGGAPVGGTPDLAQRVATHQVFWKAQRPILAKQARPFDYVEVHRQNARRLTGLVGNSLGVMLQDHGQNERAYEVYRQIGEFDPDNISVTLNRYALLRTGLHAEDRPFVEKAIARARDRMGLEPSFIRITRMYGEIRAPAVLAAVGWTWNMSHQPRLAESEMRRAIEVAADEARPSYLLTLAGMQLASEEDARGEPIYRELLAKNPQDPQALLGMARVEFLRGHAASASEWLTRVRATGSTDASIPLLQAALQMREGRPAEARKTLQELVDRHPKHLQAWAMLASLLIAEGQTAEVETTVLPRMERVAGPSGGVHYLTYLTRGYVEQAKGPAGWKAARQAFLSALSLRPGLPTIRDEVLKLDHRLGDAASAEVHARELLRTDREHALANYLLGTILQRRGETEAAADLFRRSVQRKPTALALNDLAESLRRLGRLPEAETAARQALELAPKFGLAWDTLACVLLDLRRSDEAVQAARKAVSLAGGDARLRLTLARAVAAQGDRTEVQAILEPLVRRLDTLPAELRQAVQELLGR